MILSIQNKLEDKMNKLLLTLALATAVCTAGFSALQAQETPSAKVQSQINTLREIYINIDFDGGHYYYVRIESPDKNLSTWELESEKDFSSILNDRWETGDQILIEDQILMNVTRNSQYAFHPVKAWWVKQ